MPQPQEIAIDQQLSGKIWLYRTSSHSELYELYLRLIQLTDGQVHSGVIIVD